MEQIQQPKWVFTVSTRLTQATADQIWPLLKDFVNLNKWFPGLPICYGVHSTNSEPGCIRYCAGFSLPSNGGISWFTERLIAVDLIDRIISNEIVYCYTEFKSYVSMVPIAPNWGDGQDKGCMIEWSNTVDPVEGPRLEDLVKKYKIGLQRMAKKMEDPQGAHNMDKIRLI